MKSSPDALARLLARVRAAIPAESTELPPGFATRVVARARAARQAEAVMPWWQLIERHAGRTLAVAVGMAALSVAVNFEPVSEGIENDVLAADDPITLVLDIVP